MSHQTESTDTPKSYAHALPTTTIGEEIANTLTHGLGAILSVAGLVLLIVESSLHGDAWRIVSCTIFGISLLVLYTVSTLYHSVRNPRTKYFFRILDHAAIYVLIAGSYTPFALVHLRGPWGWSLFGIVWALAIAGVIFKIFHIHRFPILSATIYLLMGWLVVVAMGEVIAKVPPHAIGWLVAGGAAYTLGIIFFAWDKLPYNHAIWHGFVLLGSFCHFWAIFAHVAA